MPWLKLQRLLKMYQTPNISRMPTYRLAFQHSVKMTLCHGPTRISHVVQNPGFATRHAVGTCKMGSRDDPMAVVESKLKFFGFSRLQVIDASVMPNVVGGDTDTATVMVAGKGVDMML